LELVSVPDMASNGAFDAAVKGCAGVIHTATPVMQSHDPNVAIPMVIAGATNALRAAAKEGIKRVVLTSSSTAAASPQPNKVFNIDPSVWNDDAVKAAWAPPPYEGVQRKLDVYSASKTQGEQAAWKFVQEEGNGMVLNCILPNMNIGEILSIEHQGYPSTMGWIKALWNGFKAPGEEELKDNPPQYYINVDDNARVHVAALIFEDVKEERLFTFAYPYSWNDLLAVFRKLYPGKKFIDDIEGIGEDKSIVANERAEELLKRLKGGEGWSGLEESVRFLTDKLAISG
jgi:nucleoside-diphosphate-sugar epimerase